MIEPGFKPVGSYLTAVSYVGAPRHRWWFECGCGKRVIREAKKVIDLHTRSCGCYRREVAKLVRDDKLRSGPPSAKPKHQRVVRMEGTGGIREIVVYCQERPEHRAKRSSYKHGRPDLFAFAFPAPGTVGVGA